MKQISLFLLFALMTSNINIANGQPDNLDPKYLSALLYLKTNKKLNEQINSFFYSKPKQQPEFIEFNVMSEIRFTSIHFFQNQINFQELDIDSILLKKPRLYIEQNKFESYNYPALKTVIEPNESPLNLFFSKPGDNFLLAELGDYDPGLSAQVKFGRGFVMLFIFNDDGSVKEALGVGIHYN